MGTDAKKPEPTKKQASAGNISEEIEDDLGSLPNMQIAEVYYLVQHQHSPASTIAAADEAHKKELLEFIKANKMTPFYKRVCSEFQWPVDQALVDEMAAANDDELKSLDERVADATQNLGDIEVLEALLAKARMYSRIGDKDAALEAFRVAGEKPQSINQKILVSLHIIRIGLFFSDLEIVEKYIKKATAYVLHRLELFLQS
jgi:26S proteasome regulatory subunit N7